MLGSLDLDLELNFDAVTKSRVGGRETRTARLPGQKIFRRDSYGEVGRSRIKRDG